MSTHDKSCQLPDSSCRRSFLSASVAIGAMGLIGAGTHSGIACAKAMTKAQREKLTPDDVLKLMKDGNKRFSSGKSKDHDYLAQQRATAAGQYPLAILLSCI